MSESYDILFCDLADGFVRPLTEKLYKLPETGLVEVHRFNQLLRVLGGTLESPFLHPCNQGSWFHSQKFRSAVGAPDFPIRFV